MKANITSIEINFVGMATLEVEVDLTDHDYEMKLQMMDKRERVEYTKSDKHKAYLQGLKDRISKIHVGEVDINFSE